MNAERVLTRQSMALCILLLASPALVCAQNSKNPHGPLKMACESCHTTLSWKPIRAKPEFDHNSETKFPLRGMHQGVQCSQCHTNPVFSKVGKLCADCHADIHARQMGAACQDCHTVRGWRVSVANVGNHFNRFPLLGAHAAVPCDACHKGAATGVFYGLSTSCVSCHLTDYQKANAPSHVAANLPLDCQTCHGIDHWQGAKFDHAAFTNFPLLGAHAQLDCSACHLNGQFAGTPVDCYSCHIKDYNAAQDPNHVTAGFPHDCLLCHSFASWQGATFNHNMTPFPLTGAHTSVQCSACHIGGKFAGTPTQCAGCHMPDFQNTNNPNHVQSGFPTQCDSCHTTTSWQGAKFDHNTTKFPLTGAHINVSCNQCHVNGQFAGTPTDCYSCHLKDYQTAASPNHLQAGYPQDCTICHTTAAWTGATFNHNSTPFPLTGAHTQATCVQCHAGGKFTGTPTDCASCHITDFNNSTNPNHVLAGFATNCAACHTTVQWKGGVFNHNTTKFPLTGAHTTVSCIQCHVSGPYSATPTDCYSCHLKDFNSASSPNHAVAGFPTSCTLCHNTTQWQGAVFDHGKTAFPLTGAHTSVQCAQCHVGGNFTTVPTDCASCHLADFNKTTNPNHVAAALPTNCAFCHSTVNWQGAQFDHSKTGFALTGAHATVQCNQCHVGGKYAGTPTDCASCHLTDFNGTNNPPHAKAGFPTSCVLCHTTTAWQPATFDHSQGPFPLTGAHKTVQCAQCHVGGNFTTTPTDCASCHLTDFNGTNNPPHAKAGFPTSCALCHTTTSWAGATFDHSKTAFPLTGAHTTVQCSQCHTNGNYTTVPTDCGSCHMADFNGTNNPPHAKAGFPTACALCHTTTSWAGATFDHSKTAFPLTGAHTTVQCAQCHTNGNFTTVPTDCGSCHMKDYTGTNNPPHAKAGFPTTCALCHTTTSWAGATFDHSKTAFPLTGAHITVQCAQCHVNNNFTTVPTDCGSCHITDYNGTNNPAHAKAGFPTTCALCHNTTSWLQSTFNHNNTPFPLTGAHTSVQCATCHVNNNFTNLSTACYSCHQNDFQGTNNPAHAAAGFPQDCSLCHTTVSWAGATFDHSKTPFPLTGAHTSVQCATCHVNNNFTNLSTACYSCHQKDYQGTNNPPHASAGFPQDCSLCHTTTSWAGATFNHNSTPFPLTGAHTSVQCATCHVNNNFTNLSTACYSCHQKDYQGTTNPAHAAAGFPQDCSICHNTTSWAGATFDHSKTPFPLTGAHTSVACASCHVNNVFAGTPTDCYSCHATEYNTTTSPNHKAAGFPTTCATCHTTTAWTGATFNHTYFPMNHGNANSVCSTCHTNSADYSVFQCTGCHTQSQTNQEHGGVKGYVWSSPNCYQCHPKGSGG